MLPKHKLAYPDDFTSELLGRENSKKAQMQRTEAGKEPILGTERKAIGS